MKLFDVIDKQTGEAPDLRQIVNTETWAKAELRYTDLMSFGITSDGLLFLLDEFGAYVFCDVDRFEVRPTNEPLRQRI